MPKRFAKRRVAKRVRRGGKGRRPVRRRTQMDFGIAGALGKDLTYANIAAGIGAAGYAYKKVKGQYKRVMGKRTGRIGQAAVDSSSGAVSGFLARPRTHSKSKGDRLTKILKTMAMSKFPIIKDHQLVSGLFQPDWTTGVQGVFNYVTGYTDTEIQDMLLQANSAQTVSTLSVITPASLETLVNQRMDIYSKSTKYNIKNTCSHTVYLEIRAYESTGYHSFSVFDCWNQALADDNMLQNSASFGTEETVASAGLRPNMSRPQLSLRWRYRKECTYKITLEPGQETSYTYVQKGGRFDKQKFNIIQGGTATPVDVLNLPGLSSQVLFFCRSETVCDALDSDVTYGSGHLAVNSELRKSWSAVPYIKPYQTSYVNAWGTIVEANELDLNQYQANNDVYEEQV